MIQSQKSLESLINAAKVAGDYPRVTLLTEQLRKLKRQEDDDAEEIARKKRRDEDDNTNAFGTIMEAEILGSLIDDSPSYDPPSVDSSPDFGGSSDGFGGGGGGDSW